ncbi:MAG: VWA domain-containing protein [Desulfarculus sp.]|jgi:uncharacterized protein with von Willebrand factor type A (vWA) domain|nr:MAG: VWA domain-containing protein [Desulfarculus sp.]
MPPDPVSRSLINALILFGDLLRRHGFKVTTAHLADVVRGLQFIRLHNKWQFQVLLRAALVSNPSEFALFTQLFRQFWERPGGPWVKEEPEEGPKLEALGGEGPLEALAETQNGPQDPERVQAGLEEAWRQKDFAELSPAQVEEMEAAIRRLALKLGQRMSRRYASSAKRGRVDLRRSLRQALKRGGELVSLEHRRRKVKPSHLHLVLDVSGSMDIYGYFFLVFMYGLQTRFRRVRSYLFSTRLTMVTPLLRSLPLRPAFQGILGLDVNWSGGTDMGRSLTQLLREHILPAGYSRNVLILVSDGWDRGQVEQLRQAMRLLRFHCRRIIWLNPLLANPEYRPLSRGAQELLPQVDHLLPFYNLESLQVLCQLLERVG